MKLFPLLFLFLSIQVFASDDFTRMQFENEHYRSYTREEFASRFGPTKALLPKYYCNQKTEFDPYWMPRTNHLKNSFKIKLYKEDGVLVYKNGKYFSEDGRKIKNHTNSFLKQVVPALKKLEKISKIRKMLRLLEKAPYPIILAHGWNSFSPQDNTGAYGRGISMANAIAIMDHGRMTSENTSFYDIGTGGQINWNPKATGFPPEISLAHEMFHSLDSVRGILDMRFAIGDGYEEAMISEYRAVYFENIARQATGVAIRTHYGNDTTGPGVLDAHGNPRFLSAPCLK